eukprot:2397025-Lingulodinium_polyedra.AAC.1
MSVASGGNIKGASVSQSAAEYVMQYSWGSGWFSGRSVQSRKAMPSAEFDLAPKRVEEHLCVSQ